MTVHLFMINNKYISVSWATVTPRQVSTTRIIDLQWHQPQMFCEG